MSQDDTDAALKGHRLNLEGALGVRRLFNPSGVIEVSWFGNAGVGYTNTEFRALLGTSYDPATGTFDRTTLQILRSHTFAVGAVAEVRYSFLSKLAGHRSRPSRLHHHRERPELSSRRRTEPA